jgi:excisionase family DNA binding protein
MSKEYVTIAEAMMILSVSRSTINRLIKGGMLTKYKVGGRVLLLREQVDDVPRPTPGASE